MFCVLDSVQTEEVLIKFSDVSEAKTGLRNYSVSLGIDMVGR
jgi:hypothetical protein